MKTKSLLFTFLTLWLNGSFAQEVDLTSTGQMRKVTVMMNDSSICHNFYLNSTPIILQCFYPNGSQKSYSTFNTERNGIYISWFQNGNIEYIENYLNDYLNGPYRSWYESGKIKEKGQYYIPKNDSIIDLRQMRYVESDTTYKEGATYVVTQTYYLALKDEQWIYYSEEGKVIKEEIWKRGELIESK